MEIRNGHLYLADLNPRFGTEAGKLRPVVVVQTNLLNHKAHSSTVICPITTQVLMESKILRVHLQAGEGGLRVVSDVMVDQVRAIDNARFKKHLGVLERENMKKLYERLKLILDF